MALRPVGRAGGDRPYRVETCRNAAEMLARLGTLGAQLRAQADDGSWQVYFAGPSSSWIKAYYTDPATRGEEITLEFTHNCPTCAAGVVK